MPTIRPAAGADDIATARGLFEEYGASLGFDLCFQNFSAELAGLPGDYAPPLGALLLAVEAADATRTPGAAEQIFGCVALRPLEPGIGEMKRLYVRPAGRSLGTGRRLAEAIVETARRIGYTRMRLDTLPAMARAIALYESLGFRDIPPYRVNPIPGARYLELDLTRR
jgi:ribosomal protein S18 acetylase RimI-like enzyme